jgi:hypothetical protein
MAETQVAAEATQAKQPKPFDAEQEITKLWAKCQQAQDDIRRFFYAGREAAVQLNPEKDPSEVALKLYEIRGKDLAKSYFPRVNVSRPSFVEDIAKLFVNTWRNQGAVVKVEKSENPNEVFIVWERCPWPTAAKNYGAPMAEDVAGCDLILQTALADVALFANKNLKIETTKAIPRGEGKCVRRVWLDQ